MVKILLIMLFQSPFDNYLILDLDPNHTSGAHVDSLLRLELLAEGDYETDPEGFNFLGNYSYVMIFLGVFSLKYVLNLDEIEKVREYLEMGGRVYAEGGDCWGADPYRAEWDSLFGIDFTLTEDGSNDLFVVEGVENTFIPGVSGNLWNYLGENYWIDRLGVFPSPPLGGSSSVFLINPTYPYNVGVVYLQGDWRTVALSFEISGLGDTSIVYDILEFLVEGLGANEEEIHYSFPFSLHPNPAREKIYLKFPGVSGEKVSISLVNEAGRKILGFDRVFYNGNIEIPLSGIPDGVYFLRVQTKRGKRTFKLTLLH
jgi:hypothetical protein